jgi:hypothetical protein
MKEYALLIDGSFAYTRHFDEKPEDIPHKGFTWHEVVRESGASAFTGIENGKWVIRTALPTLAELREQKLASLASLRWQKEIGGTTFNGMPLATDAVSQTKYIGAVVGAQINPAGTMKWKMNNGQFITLDATSIVAVAMAVRAHVQACFDNEASLRLLIEAAETEAELASVDLDDGWPA